MVWIQCSARCFYQKLSLDKMIKKITSLIDANYPYFCLMNNEIHKIDIRKLSLDELREYFLEAGEQKFRASQVYEWLWKKAAYSFEEMTNLSVELRDKLNKNFVINPIQLDMQQISSDGTIKNRFKLFDGHLIESVLIPVSRDERFTVCVSSQVGCSLACSFCATGKMDRIRNLDPAEIYDQVHLVNQQCIKHYGKRLSNIVFMGMGEPLLAYKNVLEGIAHICDENGLGFSTKRITLSTAGIAKMIIKLADDNVKFNLALSLHAADDLKRNEIMEINKSNNLQTLMEALKYFHINTKNKISYEYILLEGFNDTEEDAKALIALCNDFPVTVNIINYNPIDDGIFNRSSLDSTDKFAQILRQNRIMVTVRKSRGEDIDAACGQLANK